MNRLAYNRCYLIGAMDRVIDGGVQWRKDITPFLQSKRILVLDPCDKPIDIGREDTEIRKKINLSKEREDYNTLCNDRIIRNVDLRMVDVSDFLICNLDLDLHPCGTCEEMFWANREKKPVIFHIEQGKKKAPNWLFWTFPHEMIFSTWEEVKDYIHHIDTASLNEIEHHKRWMFFQWERLINEIKELNH